MKNMEKQISLEISGAERIKIRTATIRDFDLFWETFARTINGQFTDYSSKLRNYFLKELYSKDNFKQWIVKKEILLLLAFNKGMVVGYLLGTLPFSGTSYVVWMTVEEEFRRRGIGGALLGQYENIVKKKNADKINLWSSGANFRFYKERGYKPILKDSLKIQEWLFCKEIK